MRNGNDFLNSLIEVFEDFLNEKGIEIPNEDKMESENPSNIYGMDYGILQGELRDACLKYGLVVEDEWGH